MDTRRDRKKKKQQQHGNGEQQEDGKLLRRRDRKERKKKTSALLTTNRSLPVAAYAVRPSLCCCPVCEGTAGLWQRNGRAFAGRSDGASSDVFDEEAKGV